MDVIGRFDALRRLRPHLRLSALVDGLAYERLRSEPLASGPGRFALFEGTPDAPLAAAGPWLLDAGQDDAVRAGLLATQAQAPYVSWLLAEMPLHGLAQLLQLRLDARLPDGRTALLRFYDPRVLKSLALTLSAQQRIDFFSPVVEWHFICDGQSYSIGSVDA